MNKMKKIYYVVYMHEFPSGKKYVGQVKVTCCVNPSIEDIFDACEKQRWKHGNGYRKHNNGIIKERDDEGWRNIKHKIVGVYETEKEMDAVEAALIKQFDLTNPTKGYNQIQGQNIYKISKENIKQRRSYDLIDTKTNLKNSNLSMNELKEIVINILKASGVIPAKNIDKGLYRASKNENLYYDRFKIVKAA